MVKLEDRPVTLPDPMTSTQPSTISTSVKPADALNTVTLHVTIPAGEFERAIDAAFRKLAHEVRIDGFRPGKAPRRILESRLGVQVARSQALKDALPDYYVEAVELEKLDTIAAPKLEIIAGEDDGDVEFEATVELRPVVTVPGYEALRVEVAAPSISDADIESQVNALRSRFADLVELETPLGEGDFALIDIAGAIDGEQIDQLTATDFLYEIGSGIVVPELDTELIGKGPGDELAFDAALTERFGDAQGQAVTFEVSVKETKKKVLPEVTDLWVADVTEFSSVEEFRKDVGNRLELMAKMQLKMAMTDRVLAVLADHVEVDEIPETLLNEEMQSRLEDMAQRLDQQGATIAQYLAATGQEQDAFIGELREGAVKGVKADLGLRAVVTAESIEVSEEDLQTEIERFAQRLNQKPAKVKRDLVRRGVLEAVRSDLARRKALQFVVDHAVIVDPTGNLVDLSLPEGGVAGAAIDPQVASESADLGGESSVGEQEPEA